MPKRQKEDKRPLRSFSEKEVQERLYGDVNAKLESLKKEIDATRRKLYYQRKHRASMPARIYRYALIILITFSIALFLGSSARWIKRIKHDRPKPSAAVASAKAEGEIDAKYTIQAAVYKSEEEAEAFNKTLISKGYSPFVNTYHSQKGSAMYRVCVGKFKNKEEAVASLEKLKNEEGAKQSFLIKIQ